VGDPPDEGRSPRWERWLLALAGYQHVVGLRRALDHYRAAGGPLLAGGLAYSALFAVVPAVVLALGVTGVLLGSSADRAAIVATAGRTFPPLRELLGPIVDELARLSASITLLGLIAFVWGASRFTVALQVALALVFGTGARRGVVRSELVALASVGLLVGAVVASTLLAGLASVAEGMVSGGFGDLADPILSFLLGLGGPVAGAFGLAAVYRYVPPTRPTWRDALPPALIVGAVLAVGTRLFVIVAPRLVGAAAVFGTLAATFLALAWFGVTFQALLLGAAWVGVRTARTAGRQAGE